MILVLGVVALMIAGMIRDMESTGLDGAVLWAVLGLLALLLANFCSLTVRVDEEKLSWYFGIGLLNFSIPLKEIEKVHPIRTGFVDGIGIRFRPGRGWLYNVSGFHAVEIIRRGGTSVRIGTDEPEVLADTLKRVAG
ncbi:MAG: hypothetical protein WD510_01635 [Balneolaceae bacterium]